MGSRIGVFRTWRRLGLAAFLFALMAAAYLSELAETPVTGAAGPTTVAIVHRDGSITESVMDDMVRHAVALAGGLDSVISSGDVVVVKPNFVIDYGWDGDGITTHRGIVRAVVRVAQEAGAGTVYIAEGTAGNGRYCSVDAFRNLGFDYNHDGYDDDTGAQFIDLNIAAANLGDPPDPAYVQQVFIDGFLRDMYWMPNIIMTCDVLIDVPCWKNHGHAGVTLACKNHVGCAPGDIYHSDGSENGKWKAVHEWIQPYDYMECVNRSIADLNLCRAGDFVVVDALRGVTNGPTGDGGVDYVTPEPKMVLAGRDPIAVDTIGALLMSYDVDTVEYLGMLESRGVGTTDTAIITVVGEHVADRRYLFPPWGSSQAGELVPPTVDGLSPASGSDVYGVTEITAVNPQDNVGVVKVEFYVDGELRCSDAIAPYTFNWDTTAEQPGSHTVTAYVYDRMLSEASASATYNVIASSNFAKTFGTGWNMMSIPAVPIDADVSSVLGGLADAGNELVGALFRYSYDGGYQVYDTDFSQMAVGVGYWLFLSTAGTAGYAGNELASDAVIPLEEGWNLIGHPFNAAAWWPGCRVRLGEVTKTIPQAAEAGWIQGTIYYYESGRYRAVCADGTGDDYAVRPWRGYWILAEMSGLELVVPKP